MSEKLSMRKIRETLRLKFDLERTHGEIARSIQVSKSTVCSCLKRAKKAGLSWPLPDGLDDKKLESMLYAQPAAKANANPLDFSYIHQEMRRKGVTLNLLWCEYKERHPGGLGYSRFCENYRNWKAKIDVTMRHTHKLGESLFIDYAGMTMPVIDSKTGEIKEAEIFVAALGASDYIFAEATWTQKLPDWVASHVRAFEFFGGVPEVLIPDNLKSSTHKCHRYEPDLNPTYQDLAEHYDVAIIPARVRKPRDKSKAEQAVQMVERQILAPLRNRRFFSLDELNQAIKHLLEKVNRQPFQKLPGSRLSQFETLEKPLLRPLPSNRYEFAEWKKATLGRDYHVSLDHHYYSAPYTYVKKELNIRYTSKIVEIFYQGNRLASHRRCYKKGAHTTIKEHMPKNHQKHMEWTPERVIHCAEEKGESVGLLAKRIFDKSKHPRQGISSCLGLFKLSKSYEDRLDRACKRALAINALSCKAVESILKNNLDQQPLPYSIKEAPITKFAHDYVRGKNYFC